MHQHLQGSPKVQPEGGQLCIHLGPGEVVLGLGVDRLTGIVGHHGCGIDIFDAPLDVFFVILPRSASVALFTKFCCCFFF